MPIKKSTRQTQLLNLPRGGRSPTSPPRHASYLSAAQTTPAPPITKTTLLNKRKSETNDMESDDASIQTTTTDNTTSPKLQEVKEHVLKFSFRPRHPTDQTSVAITHYSILKQIKALFPTITIFDNHGEPLKDVTTFHSTEDYESHFNLQFKKGNTNKRRNSEYTVYHRVHTSIPLRDIRHHRKIKNLLQHHNTRMSSHAWHEDETDIVNLGFFVNVDPSNFLRDDFEDHVRSEIASKTKRNKQNIPKFKCGFTSPFHIDENGNKVSTKSYDLQVRSTHCKELIALLHRTYSEEPTFIFHRLRHSDATVYRKTIQQQNKFLSQVRVVPIHGVDARTMFYIEPKIRQIPGVQAIHRHRLTSSTGRWSVITCDQFFTPIRKFLTDSLLSWVNQYCEETNHIQDSTFPQAGLAFKQPIPDEESTGSFETYLSACVTIYSNITMDDFPDAPSDILDNRPQEWEFPPLHQDNDNNTTPHEYNIQASTEPMVRLSSFKRLQEANDALTTTVKELQAQLQFLLSQSTHTSNRFSSTLTAQTSESAHVETNMSLDSAFSNITHDSK